ncbi:hypothetical protein B0H13DRAFT_2300673 [Mycena leptocephala]|nr:hypothetical protein B0H13DRAFT_2300673 [Mycena leptocephala]
MSHPTSGSVLPASSMTLKRKRSRSREAEEADVNIVLFARPARPPTQPRPQPANVPPKTKLGISHLPLLYETQGNGMYCRSCRRAFAATPTWTELMEHAQEVHADPCAKVGGSAPGAGRGAEPAAASAPRHFAPVTESGIYSGVSLTEK